MASLELALRHLRLQYCPRTLWIDALCINQKNESEKRIQVRKMGCVYANASVVVVWLGGYHGITKHASCKELTLPEDNYCTHARQVKEAFFLVRSLKRRRHSAQLPRDFPLGDEGRFREAVAGLRTLSRRGWWQRLWVIQEVALASRIVQIQCGHDTCYFHDFYSTQILVVGNNPEDGSLREQFLSIERITTTIIKLRQAYANEGSQSRLGLELPVKAIGRILFSWLFSQDQIDQALPFDQQSFPHRLHLILFKTAGHFQCRDDRDRLYALLGIADGARTVKFTAATHAFNFIRVLGLCFIYYELFHTTSKYSQGSAPDAIKGLTALRAVNGAWKQFYKSSMYNWFPARSNYIVSEHDEIVSHIADGPLASHDRVEFFTALARYLGSKTMVLAFLDAANCGEDQDAEMPSWVPNWTRREHYKACNFATYRMNEIRALANFSFGDDGKSLKLLGWARGDVNVISLQCLWWGVPGLESEISPEIICQLYREGIITAIHGSDEGLRAMGALTAGKAVEGDRLVFVPGCFHRIILRQQTPVAAEPRWKLVGLVDMSTELTIEGFYSKSEVIQLLEDGSGEWYTVE